MRALDPASGPVERLACELRALRAAAGEPAFWKMARRCEVSKSALAAAVAGYQLPSERVTRAFVQVCDGNWAWWSERLAQARTALESALGTPPAGGSQHTTTAAALVPVHRMPLVRAKTRAELVVHTGSPSSLPARPAGDRIAGSRQWARRHRVHGRRTVIILAAVALAVLAGVATAIPPSGAPRAAPPPSLQASLRGLPAMAATAIPSFGAPHAAPLPSPQPAAPSTPTALPAAIDLVRVVYDADEGDSHVTARPLFLAAYQLGQLNAAKLGDPAHQAWFAAHGAVDLGITAVQIIVEGNRGHRVRIVDLQPVATCSVPLTGTLFLSPSQGSDSTTKLYVDLDSTRRTLRYSTWDEHGLVTNGEDFFGDYTVSLAQGEQQTFELVASSAKYYCTFTLNMTVVDGGHTVIEHISDDGRPFAVTAPAPRRAAGYYSAYRVLYIGGILASVGWVREDPGTYR